MVSFLIWAMGLPGAGVLARWIGAVVLGITNAPNVVLSGFTSNPSDPRPSHRGWYYVVVENRQREGRNARYPTKDAESTIVRLSFARAADAVRSSDGVFLKSAVEGPEGVTTLIVGRPRHVPVYLVATQTGAVDGTGVTVQEDGIYVTNGEWFHPSLTEAQRLAPGTYEVTIEVSGRWGAASFTDSLTVPEGA